METSNFKKYIVNKYFTKVKFRGERAIWDRLISKVKFKLVHTTEDIPSFGYFDMEMVLNPRNETLPSTVAGMLSLIICTVIGLKLDLKLSCSNTLSGE